MIRVFQINSDRHTFCLTDINSCLSLFITQGLRDVKSPVAFPAGYVLPLIIGCLVLGCLGAALYFSRNKKEKIEALPVDPRLPWEIAYDEFAALAKSPLLAQGRFKAFYSQLSGIVRRYFENQFKIKAPEMTTEEFLWSLEESRDLTDSQKSALKKFLNSCDIVKFAKYIPRVVEGEASFRLAKELVEETK